jgi:hypothetical protein
MSDIITIHNDCTVAWLKTRLKYEPDENKVTFKANPKCEFISHCRIWISRMQCPDSCLSKMKSYSNEMINLKEK